MSRIPESKIEEIKNKAKIEEVISSFINLQKKGNNYMGVCPFHNDNTPSLSVSPVKRMYKCFVCGVGGDVFNFVKEFSKVSYPKSIKIVADKYNIEIENYVENIAPIDKKYESLTNLNRVALDFWKYNLSQNDLAGNYLFKRKISKETSEKFELGFSLKNADTLTRYLMNKGYGRQELLDSGLVIEKEKGLIDFFRNRIIFPISDSNSKIIGFSGRQIVEIENSPKYLNSKETYVFKKQRAIFNLNNAIDSYRATKNVYIVEGFFDVISLYQAGVKNSIALMGTNITTQTISEIRKHFNSNISLIPDNDQAGKLAAIKIVKLFKNESVDIDIFILDDDSNDIDEYIKKNNKLLFLKKSLLLVELKYNYLKNKYDINNLKELDILLKEIKSELENLDNIILANKMAKIVSKELDIDYNQLKISDDYESLSDISFDEVSTFQDNNELNLDYYDNNKKEESQYKKAVYLLLGFLFSKNRERVVGILERRNFVTINSNLNNIIKLAKKGDIDLKSSELSDEQLFLINNSKLWSNLEYEEKYIENSIAKIYDFENPHSFCLNLKNQINRELVRGNLDLKKIKELQENFKKTKCNLILSKEYLLDLN